VKKRERKLWWRGGTTVENDVLAVEIILKYNIFIMNYAGVEY